MFAALMRWFAYSTWFVIALVGSLYYSIPKDDIRRFAQSRASERLKTKVSIDKLQLHGVTGLELLGVQITLAIKPPDKPGAAPQKPGAPGRPTADAPPGRPDPDGSGDSTDGETGDAPKSGDAPKDEPPNGKPAAADIPGLLIAESVRVDVNTFGLLVGQKLKARLQAEISGGSIEDTTFTMTQDGWSLVVGSMTGINLGPIKPFRTLAKMDLDLLARLSGRAEIDWGGRLQDSRGKVELQFTDTVLPYLPLKDPRQPFPIGEAFEVQVGTIDLKATLDRADKLAGIRPRPGNPVTLLIEKLTARGEHLEIQLDSGQKHTIAFVGKNVGDAEIDVTLVLSFTDAFFQWKGVGHRPDGEEVADASHVGLEMGLSAGLKSARTMIGQRAYYGFHCVGALKTFKCMPKAPSRRLTPIADPGKSNLPSIPGGIGTPDTGEEGTEGPGDTTRAGRPIPSRPPRPTPAMLPAQNTPNGRTAQNNGLNNGAGRNIPRLVEPTRPSEERLNNARRFNTSGQPGDSVGPGFGGGAQIPPPEPDPLEPAPLEPEPIGAEPVPEPIPTEPAEGGEVPAEPEPGVDDGADGADGVPPGEGDGGEIPAEDGGEVPE